MAARRKTVVQECTLVVAVHTQLPLSCTSTPVPDEQTVPSIYHSFRKPSDEVDKITSNARTKKHELVRRQRVRVFNRTPVAKCLLRAQKSSRVDSVKLRNEHTESTDKVPCDHLSRRS